MNDTEDTEPSLPARRVITEQELLEALNRSLWEVERRRVEEFSLSPRPAAA